MREVGRVVSCTLRAARKIIFAKSTVVLKLCTPQAVEIQPNSCDSAPRSVSWRDASVYIGYTMYRPYMQAHCACGMQQV